MEENKKVMVAMSGGVDSAVSAFLLKEAGYEVVGATMCLGVASPDASSKQCCGPQAVKDARRTCDGLEIPHYVFDFSDHLQKWVIENFISEYSEGRTPNPCIRCNQFLKFDILLKQAKSLGYGYLATGHYAQIMQENGNYVMKKGKDNKKDQTYFLYSILKDDLPHVLFPVGHLIKGQVRRIARKANLPVAEKTESMDICFTPNYRELFQHLPKDSGDFINRQGEILGKHKGIINYTVGQRKGLGINHLKPLYVLSIDAKNNTITVGERWELKRSACIAKDMNMHTDSWPEKLRAKVRYHHRPGECDFKLVGNTAYIRFHFPQEAVTPGQSVVIYDEDTVIGGGIIETALDELDFDKI